MESKRTYLKSQKVKFGQAVHINDDSYFIVHTILENNKIKTNEVLIEEFNSEYKLTDSYTGTPEEIEKFVRRDYEMKIKLPTIGF